MGFQKSTVSNQTVTCVSNEHGLAENQRIQIFGTDSYNGIYSVSNIQQDTFDIEIKKEFVKSEEGQWIELDRRVDPYSFQLSFVFPDWLPRFKNENFKQLIYNIISAEIPAHITPSYHWLDFNQMRDFEIDYQLWLNTIVDKNVKPNVIKSTTNKLIETLGIASVEITAFNVLGYMTIGTDFIVD